MAILILILNIIAYFLCFFVIWYGAGLMIRSVNHFAHKLNLSSFAVSFFVLGLLTSIPEFFVGVSSIIDQTPEIFVGNLLGGILVLFLFIIPLLAIFGNGIVLDHQLDKKNLLFALTTAIAPSFLLADKKISFFEALFLIIIYCALIYTIEKRKTLLEKIQDQLFVKKNHIFYYFFNLVLGLIMVVFASKFLVDKTVYFSQLINISPFVVSVIILALGTNLPELSVAVRAVVGKEKGIAFGDYLGSAVANSFLIGILTLFNGGQVVIADHFIRPFIFTFIGLVLFFIFTRSRNDLSRQEGLVLLFGYIIFLISEIF